MLAAVITVAAVTSACSVERVSEVDETSFATDLAAVECAFYFSCECEDYGYPDEAFCRDSLEGLYDALVDPARKAGLTFDPQCAQEAVDSYASEVCLDSVFDGVESDGTCSYCSIYHGDKAVGEDCTIYAEFDDCATGLYCDEGKCVDPCAVAAQGEPCDSGSIDGCEPGFHCPLDEDPVCTKTPTMGEACEFLCAGDLYCSFDGVCAATPKLGEACEGPCAEGSACSNDGVCVEPPGPDEECASGECRDDSYCDWGDLEGDDPAMCRARKAAGEDCVDFSECLSGDCEGTCLEAQSWVCE